MLKLDELMETVVRSDFSSSRALDEVSSDEVWGKVMFLHVSVILFTGGGRYDVTLSGCLVPCSFWGVSLSLVPCSFQVGL